MAAIDPAAARGDAGLFGADVDRLIALMRATVPIDPDQPVLVPGDPEHEAEARRRAEGIPMVPPLVEEVRAVTAASGVPFLLTS